MITHAMQPDQTSMRLDKNISATQRIQDYWNVAPERPLTLAKSNNNSVMLSDRIDTYWNEGAAGLGPRPKTGNTAAQPDEIAGIAKSLDDVLSKFINKPIKVDVDVKNGNIVAEVNKANSQQARRN
jgi:hypothetical protein